MGALAEADIAIVVGGDGVAAVGASAKVVEARRLVEVSARFGEDRALEQVVEAGVVLVQRQQALALQGGEAVLPLQG